MPKAIQLLINSMLPESSRNYSDIYDGKTLNRILVDLAQNHPDKFAEIQHKIASVGRKASYLQGESITLKDLAPVINRQEYYDAMDAEINALDKKDPQFRDKRDAIHQKYNTLIEKDTAKAALANRNEIAMTVLSGARGKNPQLKAMVSTPGTYSDYLGRPIPVFSRQSFAEGVRPALFLASTYGSRASVISTKSSTAKGGDLAKQFASAAANLVVRKEDCGTENGRELEIDDPSLKGRALAIETAGIPAGTYVDKEVMKKLRKAGVKTVVARSMLTCGVENGVCTKCVGHFYHGGKLAKVGTHIGAIASSASMEPVTQMALSAKHTAGMTQSKRSYSGIPYITQFSQSPEAFKDKAPVAEEDGRVASVEEAPQGGHYVTVGEHKHYVPVGHAVLVKPGDQLEAGDALSEGLVDAEDIIRTRGLGAGRLYFADRLNQILADSGAGTDKRNTEALARAVIRHVHIDNPDGLGVYLPGDTADYEAVAATYAPPETSREMRPSDAVGLRLQRPVLHHTIGTRVTPRMAKSLERDGYKSVLVDESEPDFSPEMERLRTASHATRDWLASQTTSYLSQQLGESAVRGDDTNVEHNEDYRPRLMYGKGFGKDTDTTGVF